MKERTKLLIMVLAVMIAEGAKGPENCPPLKDGLRKTIQEYMAPFKWDT